MEGEDVKIETEASKTFRCSHYKRKCEFFTPCCQTVYRCRFCHDEKETTHKLKRSDVEEIVCSGCGTRQSISDSCTNCKLVFGKYFCQKCKLYDDEDKKQFHCDGCGICRIGGRENYFHCSKCDMCLPVSQEHVNCVEKISRRDCPVCLEDIHTSRTPSHIPPCSHLIHSDCFLNMLKKGIYSCPICGSSVMDMKEMWELYDSEIADTPLPKIYQDLFVKIYCRDCHKISHTDFHFMGNKCPNCQGYNTVRERGPLLRKTDGEYMEAVLIEEEENQGEEEEEDAEEATTTTSNSEE